MKGPSDFAVGQCPRDCAANAAAFTYFAIAAASCGGMKAMHHLSGAVENGEFGTRAQQLTRRKIALVDRNVLVDHERRKRHGIEDGPHEIACLSRYHALIGSR
jgi:hypothetical protein